MRESLTARVKRLLREYDLTERDFDDYLRDRGIPYNLRTLESRIEERDISAIAVFFPGVSPSHIYEVTGFDRGLKYAIFQEEWEAKKSKLSVTHSDAWTAIGTQVEFSGQTDLLRNDIHAVLYGLIPPTEHERVCRMPDCWGEADCMIRCPLTGRMQGASS